MEMTPLIDTSRIDSPVQLEYQSRMNRVVDYIETNLDHPFTLDELADTACFSKFHFHRIFHAIMGETLFAFIQRLRIEKAARLLIASRQTPVTRIALDCGFSSSAALARSFKERFGMSATQWRNTYGINPGNCVAQPNREPRNKAIGTPVSKIQIECFDPLDIVYLRYIGPYKGDETLFQRLFTELFAWTVPRGLVPGDGVDCLVIYHDDIEITRENQLRISVAIPAPRHIQVDRNIGRLTIEGGRYVRARFRLEPQEYVDAWEWLYRQWLPASGCQPDDRPSFEWYPTHENRTCDSKRTVDICIPVKPL